MSRRIVPRVAAIHDLAGYGRSSLTAVMPVLAYMGVQVCPLPTAVLSSQTTGMSGFSFCDLTVFMDASLEHWQAIGLDFDAVYSGFLGNPRQVDAVLRCAGSLLAERGFLAVDPVLGDDGRLDPTQTEESIAAMRDLVRQAKVITPNLTEAALLLGREYCEHPSDAQLKDLLSGLADLGPDIAVITGVGGTCEKGEGQDAGGGKPSSEPSGSVSPSQGKPAGCGSAGSGIRRIAAYERSAGLFWQTEHPYIPVYYPGTGDAFASAFLGGLLSGTDVSDAMALAAGFVYEAVHQAYECSTPPQEGALIEKALPLLVQPVRLPVWAL
ncbi:MAG: bifunctional hydroxymethylpyrimidine kinase/phosphomethylpyrimidine kinase [Mailhella sp.]|nr:bifunctional hydroxymethylpyrimidine kinase/phosphomethylpyrimidine kinase [Mailhella sp.]